MPAGGSKLEKAINYTFNHKETIMNYLLDGRCEISNNAAERRAKTYVTGRKNSLFHDTADGATASAIVLSLIETAKANNLNIYHYLYTLLLYMPDYKNEPAGIKQPLPEYSCAVGSSAIIRFAFLYYRKYSIINISKDMRRQSDVRTTRCIMYK